MSKAFTRESDDGPDIVDPFERSAPLPPGARNYVTQSGIRRLKEELEELIRSKRPAVASVTDAPERGRQLKGIDQRIRHLENSVRTSVVVPPPPLPWNVVLFGASVVVEENGHRDTYRIVGADEADPERGWVSFFSPIAGALLKAKLGQQVKFKTPEGDRILQVVEISYEADA